MMILKVGLVPDCDVTNNLIDLGPYCHSRYGSKTFDFGTVGFLEISAVIPPCSYLNLHLLYSTLDVMSCDVAPDSLSIKFPNLFVMQSNLKHPNMGTTNLPSCGPSSPLLISSYFRL